MPQSISGSDDSLPIASSESGRSPADNGSETDVDVADVHQISSSVTTRRVVTEDRLFYRRTTRNTEVTVEEFEEVPLCLLLKKDAPRGGFVSPPALVDCTAGSSVSASVAAPAPAPALTPTAAAAAAASSPAGTHTWLNARVQSAFGILMKAFMDEVAVGWNPNTPIVVDHDNDARSTANHPPIASSSTAPTSNKRKRTDSEGESRARTRIRYNPERPVTRDLRSYIAQVARQAATVGRRDQVRRAASLGVLAAIAAVRRADAQAEAARDNEDKDVGPSDKA